MFLRKIFTQSILIAQKNSLLESLVLYCSMFCRPIVLYYIEHYTAWLCAVLNFAALLLSANQNTTLLSYALLRKRKRGLFTVTEVDIGACGQFQNLCEFLEMTGFED